MQIQIIEDLEKMQRKIHCYNEFYSTNSDPFIEKSYEKKFMDLKKNIYNCINTKTTKKRTIEVIKKPNDNK